MIDESVVPHLESMRNAAVRAIAIVSSTSYERFADDVNAQAATAMFLIVIGDAASKIAQASPSLVAAHGSLPWEKMRGLRNRIVHDYETLHVPTIWATAQDSLPVLLSGIDALLAL